MAIFDEIVDRRGTGAVKWDTMPNHDTIPMWVADMDFKTAPAIIDALRSRVEQGVFGYTYVPETYYDAIIRWFGERHGWSINRKEILYTIGVVPALSAIVKALTRPGDKVIIQPPVYNCFFSSVANNGCETLENNLVYTDGRYTIDFADLERKAADPAATLMIVCNPHNPAGRVWTADELRRIGDICIRHNVAIISDEIHCELTFNGHDYTPFASLGEEYALHSVSCVSPSKAFNIAGLQIANMVTRNDEWLAKIDRAVNINEVCDVNPFGVAALMAAYNHGAEWLEELKAYLWDNYLYVRDFFKHNFPNLTVTELEGTYLMWIDCRSTGLTSAQLEQRLLDIANVRVNSGTMYGAAGEGFIRLNIACPRSMIEAGLQRLKKAL